VIYLLDNQFLCKLKNKSYSIQDISTGEHTVSVVSGGISNGKHSVPLKITVVEDKVTYISIVSTQSSYVNKLTYQEITQNSAEPLLAKATQNKDCLPTK
jgi:predicted nucleic acid-binding Zn finger protein